MSVVVYEDVENIVLIAFKSNAKIISYSLKSLEEQNGVLGSHFSLYVVIKDDNNQIKTQKFFVKTRPNCPLLQEIIMDDYNFQEEENFCRELLPRMLQVYHGEKWMPLCYLTNKNVLVFEDLSVQNYAIRTSILLDEQSLKAALTTLARFHASSVLLEYNIKKPLKEAYPNSFEEKVYNHFNKLGKGTIVGYNAIAMMAKRFNFDSNLIPKIYDRVYNLIRSKEAAFNVICHGDLWKNNIMFENSKPPKCLLVDFQLLRYASPFVDVAMLLFIHSTPKDRSKFEMDMVKHYYSTLRSAVEQSNNMIDIPSFDNLLIDYQERRLIGLTYALLFLPFAYLKPELFTAIMSDPKMLRSWYLINREDIISANMNENPEYENKLREIIIELFEEAKGVFDEYNHCSRRKANIM